MSKRKIYKYKIDGDITYIDLSKNGKEHICIIDTQKLQDFLNFDYAWFAGYRKEDKDYYVQSTVYLGIINGKSTNKTILLHDFLLGFPETEHIDHKNNNRMDNRILNLRRSTIYDNNRNRKNKNSNNTSGYRNVSWISGWWRIQLQINKKNHIFPDKFIDIHEAGIFAKKMREKYYGEFSGNN